jgi:hypothetical protein
LTACNTGLNGWKNNNYILPQVSELYKKQGIEMKKLLPVIILMTVCFTLSGCAEMIKAQKLREEKAISQLNLSLIDAPTCNTREECDNLMDVAQVWVNKNSRMKIQIATNAIINTYNDPYHIDLSFTVTKEPFEKGYFKIIMRASNGGCVTVRCIENEVNLRIQFNNELNNYSRQTCKDCPQSYIKEKPTPLLEWQKSWENTLDLKHR